MPEFPTGVITLLFTDVVGSTRLWERHPEVMRLVIPRHDQLLRTVVERHGGVVFKTVGDAVCAAFAVALDGLHAAFGAQLALMAEPWDPRAPIQVRMALHSGPAELLDRDYLGQTLNRVARLLAVAHGRQILLSGATASLLPTTLPAPLALLDLGAHRLKDLAQPEQIFQLLAPELPQQHPPLRSLETRLTNIGPVPTPQIGRDGERAQIGALLAQPGVRLVTLTGPGGIGKTSLALRTAGGLLDRYPDGVYQVLLEQVRSPVGIVPAIAAALGVAEADDQPIALRLASFLRERQLLLLLDNLEQVAAAAPVGELLAAAPQVQLLATSRAPLRVYGERELPVAPLRLPPDPHAPPAALIESEAVRLFVERAQAVRPGFALTAENSALVAAIVARLDGVPLAIELAAARSKLYPPAALLARLERPVAFLTGGAQNLPPRQQTLHHAIGWSYDLLDPAEQQIFARLAVFVGGADLVDAAEVCGEPDRDSVGLLEALLDKSLLRLHEAGDAPRVTMLEIVRDFALARLTERGELARLRRLHAEHALRLVLAAEPQLRGPDQALAFARLDLEQANLNAALEWAAEHAPQVLGQLVANLWYYWLVRGQLSGGQRWLELAAAAECPAALRAALLAGVGVFADRRGSSGAAQRAYEASLAAAQAAQEPALIAAALRRLGELALSQGAYGAAQIRLSASQAAYQTLADQRGLAEVGRALGGLAAALDQPDLAQTELETALQRYGALGDVWGVASVHSDLGRLAATYGDLVVARAHYEASYASQRAAGNRPALADTAANLGMLALELHDLATARGMLSASLAQHREIGDQRGSLRALYGLALVALNAGETAAARQVLADALDRSAAIGDATLSADLRAAAALAALAAGDFAAARRDAAAAAQAHAAAGNRAGAAAARADLALAALAAHDLSSAAAELSVSFAVAWELGLVDVLAQTLEGAAALALARGAASLAAALLGTAAAQRERGGASAWPVQRAAAARTAAAAEAALGAAFAVAYQRGQDADPQRLFEEALAS